MQDTSQSDRIFIDIPIGLRRSARECDQDARKKLGHPRLSSVFPAPAREVLEATNYEDAKRRSQAATGKALSKQTFNILPKIREVDRLLYNQAEARQIVREIHPEICFWALAGRRPMKFSKKRKQGFQERVDILKHIRPTAEQEISKILGHFRRKDVARDDAVDAMVAAITASADAAVLRTLPLYPARDAVGLPMEMVYVESGEWMDSRS